MRDPGVWRACKEEVARATGTLEHLYIYLSTHRSLAPSGWKISHSPSVLNIPILILDALQNQFFSFFFGSKKVAETLFS